MVVLFGFGSGCVRTDMLIGGDRHWPKVNRFSISPVAEQVVADSNFDPGLYILDREESGVSTRVNRLAGAFYYFWPNGRIMSKAYDLDGDDLERAVQDLSRSHIGYYELRSGDQVVAETFIFDAGSGSYDYFENTFNVGPKSETMVSVRRRLGDRDFGQRELTYRKRRLRDRVEVPNPDW